MRFPRPLISVAIILAVSLNFAIPAGSVELGENPQSLSLDDFPDQYVEDELIVMFRDDTGRHAPRAKQEGFSRLLQDASAGSLDELIDRYGVRKMQRVFRGLEDANGRLRSTARARAVEQRKRYPRRQARLGPLDDVPALENVFLLKLDPGADIPTAVAEFAQDARVVYAHPNYLYRLSAAKLPPHNAYIPDDPFLSTDGINWSNGAFGQSFPDLYGLRNINAIRAWNEFDTDDDGVFGPTETRPGEGVVVAVIDSGLDASHPDGVTVWTNPDEIPGNGQDDDINGLVDDINGWDFVDEDASPEDPYGHGTHVSGTIGAAPDNATGLIGVAPWVEIMPLRALNEEGKGTAANLAAALDYAVDKGADVLSNSWGGPTSGTISAAFANAYTQGVLAIAAAGNNNFDVTDISPAKINTVISVAATDEEDVKASFSNFGHKVDISAPGVQTLSLSANAGNNTIVDGNPNVAVGTDYMVISGTSMACPHVAGAAAVLISQFPNETIDEIRGRLRAGADAIDAQNPDFIGRLGAGRLNVLGSLQATAAPDLSFDTVSTSGFLVSSSSAEIVVKIRNHWQSTTDVQGVLSTSSPGATIQNGSFSFGDIAITEAVSNNSSPFVVLLDAAATPGVAIDFELALTSPGYQVTLYFSATPTIFENVSESTQLPSNMAVPWHVVIQDYNADGDADVSVSGLLPGQTLYENQGDGTFALVDSNSGFIKGYRVLMIDLDSDGDEDIFMTPTQQASDNILLRNDAGTLIDITDDSGMAAFNILVMSAMDFDGDGDVDIIAGGVPDNGRSTYVLRNNGDETFTDVFASSGLHELTFSFASGRIGLNAVDYDNDGDSDLIVVASFNNRTLSVYQNDGFGFFTDVTDDAIPGGTPGGAATASAAGDYDNDGDLDLYVSFRTSSTLTSALYRNNGDATFTDVTASTGELADLNLEAHSSGSEFFDYDNDGDLDLYVVRNGSLPREDLIDTDSNTLFENNGDGTFSVVNDSAFGPNIRPNLAPAAIGDYDNDGLLDIYAPASTFAGGNHSSEGGMLRNASLAVNNWIHLDLEGVTSNRDAYGARIIVTTGATSRIREIYTSAVDPTTAHFGLGAATIIDSIEVRWPSGIVQSWVNVAVNQRVELLECSDADANGVCDSTDNCPGVANDQSDSDADGVGDACDNCIVDSNWGQVDTDGDSCGNICDADYDQSGLVGLEDFGIAIQIFGTTDLRGDHTEPVEGIVELEDFDRFEELFFTVPGPSAVTSGTTACP